MPLFQEEHFCLIFDTKGHVQLGGCLLVLADRFQSVRLGSPSLESIASADRRLASHR